MRYYTLDENGQPMCTDAIEVIDDWTQRDLLIFDTVDDMMIPEQVQIKACECVEDGRL